MKRALAPLAAVLALLAPGAASPCGGFFGSEVEVDPDQEIVVVYRGGNETYLFSPRFCGTASAFGVILPIPAPLGEAPSLADPAIFEELDRYTEPTRVEVCASSGGIGCGAAGAGGPGGPGFGTGVDVVDQGRVGIFEYSVVQAATADAFTNWLTTNGYPYDPGAAYVYDAYVGNGWYFVAFRVSADAGGLEPGQRLCGDLGPIRLSFPSASPFVPARISGVNTHAGPLPTWRVFLVASEQQRVTLGSGFDPTLYFSGTLAHGTMSDFPSLTGLSLDGERLTAIDVRFPYGGAPGDIAFEVEAVPADHRSVIRVSKDCGGCEAGGTPTLLAGLLAALGVLRAAGRGARRRRS